MAFTIALGRTNSATAIGMSAAFWPFKIRSTGRAAPWAISQLKDKTLVATLNAAYRAVDGGSWWLDVETGARIWAMNLDLAFDVVPLAAARSSGVSKSWADPIVGVRARANLGQGFFVQGHADVGGFGLQVDVAGGGPRRL